MKLRNRKTALLIFLITLACAMPVFSANQSWVKNTLTLDITDFLDIRFSQESRYVDTFVFAGSPDLKNLQVGLSGHLPWNIHVGAAYRMDQVVSTGGESSHIIGALGWKLYLFGLMRFDIGGEFHYIDETAPAAATYNSYYLDGKLTFGLRVGDLRFYPFGWYRAIIGNAADSSFSFDNIVTSRISAGLQFQMRWGIMFNVFYTWEDVNGTANRTINTGFDLNF